MKEWAVCRNCLLSIRISDNVFGRDSWRVDILHVKDGVVRKQTTVYEGCYQLPNMMGWTVKRLKRWSNFKSGNVPLKNKYEVKLVEKLF